MQMDRERRNGNYNHFGLDNHDYCPGTSSKLFPISSSPSPSSPSSPSGVNGHVKFIEHPVSRMDTLAGVAIKYGVEVADIKRMNGLVTDLQMFALKSLQIPLPGRHPPSPCLSNDVDSAGRSNNDRIPPHSAHCGLLESFQSLRVNSQPVSPAMSSLQGYYGLKPTNQKTSSEGLEMAVYPKEGSQYLEDGPFPRRSLGSNQPLSRHRKSRSLVNAILSENGELADDMQITEARESDSDKLNEKLVRRRQKSEVDFGSHTPEMLLEDSSGGGFSATKGKGLALRPKSASRTALAADAEAGWLNPIPIGLGDSLVVDSFAGVRKSSSTSSLQEQDSSSSSSIWSTSKWNLMPDLQARSAGSITRPIFDGLPKPMTGRRNKTAVD